MRSLQLPVKTAALFLPVPCSPADQIQLIPWRERYTKQRKVDPPPRWSGNTRGLPTLAMSRILDIAGDVHYDVFAKGVAEAIAPLCRVSTAQIALEDPMRPSVPPAIRECYRAGFESR